MAISLITYLRARGFRKNPFATTNAEQEQELLPSFFVRVDWFDWLVGNPQQPESLILFAPQGYGKTSHRLEVARMASESREASALIVVVNDFAPLIEDGIEQVSLGRYITLIRQLTLEALDAQLASPLRQASLQRDPAAYARFGALLRLFAPRFAIGKSLPPATEEYLEAFRKVELTPKAWLKELSALAGQAGFASVYVLLDGIDELTETRDKPDRMFRLLSPLLDAPGLLQECGFAFKFFLPQDIEQQMRQHKIGRLDRIPSRSLTWTVEQLVEMLSQRLISYSRVTETSMAADVIRFQELCADDCDFDVDRSMAERANSSPRSLIDMARRIVELHCETVSDTEVQIGAQVVERVLRQAASSTAVRSPMEPMPAQVATSDPADPPLLYVDKHGDVWLGATRRDTNLPKMLRKCLEYLWEHRGGSVQYKELEQVLYGSDTMNRGDPHASRDKLIRRLRDWLEPGHPGSRKYIDVQTGVGYVLRNYRDHPASER